MHAEFGFGKRNEEGEIILEFANALNFVVANTWFKKNEGRLITYEIPGKCRTVIDHIPNMEQIGCSMDMERRKQEYFRARELKRSC